MFKRILIFTAITMFFFLLGYFINKTILESNELVLSFSLLTSYSFNALACIVVYILIEIVVEHIPNETGYLYLGLLMVKLGLFILIFKESIFSERGLTKVDKTCILLPLLFFLAIETIGVSKLLNSK